jgi:hypothetical protein
MTQDEIIEMAKQAGMDYLQYLSPEAFEKVVVFAKLVAEYERKECAKLAMTISEQGLPEEMPEGDELLRSCEQIAGGVLIADAIRARGQA